ncbi:MAG: diacylglycerol kinase family lipid kinase [Lewinellaceae bacterium]|nr:diacylglycerol kinase family lipid kinase [Lewinellaceae bacterium]
MVFIVNPAAGVRLQRHILDGIERHLDHRKFIYGIWHTEKRGHAIELTQKAIAEQYDIVVAVGGDGSVNEVASALLHTKVQLGVIPAGSGNGLAMHLGYGRNINKAIEKLNFAKPQIIDAGRLNGRPFFNLAGIGFDGLVSNLMKGKNKRGFIPYFMESVKAGLQYQSKTCTIEANGQRIEGNFFAITVANGPMYGYNVQIAPGAELDDGIFSVVLLKDAPRWQYFAAVPSALNGRFFDESFVEHFAADRLSIRSAGTNYVHLDGEGFTTDEDIELELLPKALHILKPSNLSSDTSHG